MLASSWSIMPQMAIIRAVCMSSAGGAVWGPSQTPWNVVTFLGAHSNVMGMTVP